jgi:hypothetical protein
VLLKSSKDEDKAYKARSALSRMETLQQAGMLLLLGLSSTSRQPRHTDAVIIEILRETPESVGDLKLISEDRDLRMRATQLVNDRFKDRFSALTATEVLERAVRYLKAKRLLKEE